MLPFFQKGGPYFFPWSINNKSRGIVGYKLGEQNPQESHPRTPAKYHGAHTYVKCTRMLSVHVCPVSLWKSVVEAAWSTGLNSQPQRLSFRVPGWNLLPLRGFSDIWEAIPGRFTLMITTFYILNFPVLWGGGFLENPGVLKRYWKQMDMVDGQIIISFHQPRCLWNRVNSRTKPPFGGPRSCEVAIIWPEYVHILFMEEIRWTRRVDIQFEYWDQ